MAIETYTPVKSPKQVPPGSAKPPSKTPGRLPAILLLAGILLVCFIRIRMLSLPLERDEGEYAYCGQLILQGIPPYSMAYNLKLPGTYYSYALMMAAFGQSSRGIHLGLMAVCLGSMLLTYFIARRLFDNSVGAIAAVVVGLVSVSPTLYGQAAHATHFVTFFMLIGFYLLLLASYRHSLLFSLLGGIAMGLAGLCKQPGLFFWLFGPFVLTILHDKTDCPPGSSQSGAPPRSTLPSLLAYGAGLMIPIGLTLLGLRFAGVFDRFWFWTMVYPQAYGSRIPVMSAWTNFKARLPEVTSVFTALWVMAGLGVPALLLYPARARSRIVAALFLFFSFLTCIPGFHFRQHYFLPLVPALGIMVGVLIATINERAGKRLRAAPLVTAAFFAVAVAGGLIMKRGFFFEQNPTELCRTVYGGNPFPESLPVAQYIKQNTREDDRIFVYGSEPQLYFYSNRKSATGYIYMYDLAYRHLYLGRMQSDMIREVELNRPRMIVYVSTTTSWLAEPNVIDPLAGWLAGYLRQNRYVPVFWADINFPRDTIYVSGEMARTYARKSENCMVVFRRGD
jgi:hypothetical protein